MRMRMLFLLILLLHLIVPSIKPRTRKLLFPLFFFLEKTKKSETRGMEPKATEAFCFSFLLRLPPPVSLRLLF